jgi:hypothetical protein
MIEAADPSAGGWGYGIQVLNLSAGSTSYDELYRNAMNYVAMMGRVFVAAKGNGNTSQFHYPSDYDGSWVISVGATNRAGTRAVYPDPGWPSGTGSNYGNGIDVVAPGTMILSTMPTYSTYEINYWGFDTNYDSLSGTSMATPHVAGLATLLMSQNPNLHPQDVQGIIRASADDKGDTGYDNYYGAGRINSGRAMEYMQSPWTLSYYSTSGGTTYSVSNSFLIQLKNPGGGLATGNYLVKRYDVRKTITFPTQYSITPYVWGRGVNASVGWSAANPNYQTGYCNVLWSNATQAQLQTFVYEFFDGLGQSIGWYPATVGNAVFAYSILGAPLSGPPTTPQNLNVAHSANHHPLLTWTANIDPVVSYKVYKYVTGWQYLATVTGTSYEDLTETYCTAPPPAQCESGHNVSYRVTAIDNQSLESIPSETIVTHVTGGMPDKIALENNQEVNPTEYSLEQNFPNPFNPSTRIRYSIKANGFVSLKVYDILGNEVMTLINELKSPGIFETELNATNLPSGVYIYSLHVNEFISNQKMIVLK